MKKPTKNQFNSHPNPYTIGIDLGDKFHAVCILGIDGEVIDELVVENTRDALSRSLGGYGKAGALTIIEAGGQSAWIARHLSEIGLEVIVANPRKLRLIAESYTKTDANDAKLLARLGRVDRDIFSVVEHRIGPAHR